MGILKKLFGRGPKQEINEIDFSESHEEIKKTGPTLDYDFHLKPATQIKKTNGEDAAIEYLLKLKSEKYWSDFDKYSILKKMAGYFKKCNSINQDLIQESFEQFVNDEEIMDSDALYHAFTDYSRILKYKGDYEAALHMISGAMSSINPQKNSYYLQLSEVYENKVKVLEMFDLSKKNNAIELLYNQLNHTLYDIVWIKECDLESEGKRFDNLIRNFDKNFPFNKKPFLIALNTLSISRSVTSLATEFQAIILKDEAFTKFKLPVSSQMINGIVNDFLKRIDSINN